jgi:cell division protein FtsB
MESYPAGAKDKPRLPAFRDALAARLSALGSWERSALGLPRVLWSFLAVFLLGIVLVSLVGDQGLVAYWMLRAEREALRREVAELESRERALLREIEALRSDPSYIEQVARRELGFIKPGEIVVQLPEPDGEK